MNQRTVITGTGSYIPALIKSNRDFTVHDFYSEAMQRITTSPEEVVHKFEEITGIKERRYAKEDLNASDLGTEAAKLAILDSGVDPETLDMVIVAHNFGNVVKHTIQTDILPALASRIKHNLGIKNPDCVAYDILFGCPGWIQGVIQAHTSFKAGMAKKALVIGTETLSRVLDNYDRDSMIFSDGSGACVVESVPEEAGASGILHSTVQSHTQDEAFYLYLGPSNFPGSDPRVRYIKMKGRKVYEFAMKNVPVAMKNCLDASGTDISELKMVFIHQANEKMDEGILKLLYRSYGIKELPKNIMPMSIHKLGNSSVATVPTLFDLVRKGKEENHTLAKGDVVLFASVGAGMNINAIAYRI